ncbi:hypothetical protein G647_05448 [Cladophialophora carrionii CBS 160.54]|uniref:Mediator of RNA polymerase II transcription subunit 6 n=1 Tax=Cladophialophora carrionii CBS 160.54 TaxID=1279043 RepID=V9DAC5_9EURO|nr:uncharacterized protein G647_05448 [Cladophialophora carrionii CBS 160.54]ETI23646.1 hypothetical protein G647_05448 [Cladophialophora carrionii CBS 160.54]
MAENKDDLSDKAHFDPNWISYNGGYLHSNNVLFYFATSPFFDQVSGNQSLITQWVGTPNQNEILGTRARFEANLRHQRGIQYVVEHDPLEEKATIEGPNGPENTNVWVIRKQNRQNERDDSVTVLGYYYIVNNVIYQAPTVASILNNRLLNTVSALNKLFNAPMDMSLFSVSHGHTYYKPVKPSTRQGPPGAGGPQSREGSVVPESGAPTAEKVAVASQASEESGSGARTAWEALRMTIAYGKEYSDDMPLVGEPGNFRFSKNKDTAATAGQTKPQNQASSSPIGTPGHSRAGSVAAPPPSNAAAAPRVVRTGDKATPTSDGTAKIKRKKSKVDGGSP